MTRVRKMWENSENIKDEDSGGSYKFDDSTLNPTNEYYNMIRHSIMNGDLDKAAKLTAVTMLYVYDQERVYKNNIGQLQYEDHARTWNGMIGRMKNMFKRMDPLYFASTHSTSGMQLKWRDKKKEFLKYLDDGDGNIKSKDAIALSNEYWARYRLMLRDHYHGGNGAFDKVVKHYWDEGQLMDVFPFPAQFANAKSNTFESDLNKLTKQYQ